MLSSLVLQLTAAHAGPRPVLKKAELLKRDPREKERKKYGSFCSYEQFLMLYRAITNTPFRLQYTKKYVDKIIHRYGFRMYWMCTFFSSRKPNDNLTTTVWELWQHGRRWSRIYRRTHEL